MLTTTAPLLLCSPGRSSCRTKSLQAVQCLFAVQQGAPVIAAGSNGSIGGVGSPAMQPNSLGPAQFWQQQQPQHMPAQTPSAHGSAGLAGMWDAGPASPLPFGEVIEQDMLSPTQPFRESWLQGIAPMGISQQPSTAKTAHQAGSPNKLQIAQSAITASVNNNSARAAPSQQVGPSTSRTTRKRNRASRSDDKENMQPGMSPPNCGRISASAVQP